MEILYEDNNLIVCYKPAGVPTQTMSVAQQDMETMLLNYLKKQDSKAQIHIIHRLDQPVEGVMVFAKDAKSAADLSGQVTGHTFKKKYYAIVTGEGLQEDGILEDLLVKDTRTNLSRVTKTKDKNAKQARLAYRIIDRWEDKKLLDIELFTGRHHQIRVQLSSRKSPILGDTKYGGQATGRSLALCSHYIGFSHPVTGEFMEFDIKPQGVDFMESPAFAKGE